MFDSLIHPEVVTLGASLVLVVAGIGGYYVMSAHNEIQNWS